MRAHAANARPARNLIWALTADTGGAALAGRSTPRSHHGRTGLHVDLEGDASAQVLPMVVQMNAETIPAHPLSIDEVCTTVSGSTALTEAGSPFEAIAADHQHIATAAIAQPGEHPMPEFGALGLLDPDTQNLFDAVDIDADHHVGGACWPPRRRRGF